MASEPDRAGAASAVDGAAAAPEEPASTSGRKPTVALVIGMAGSGKTALVRAMSAHMAERSMGGYVINLDPAVRQLPYEPNIDIRDTVNYKNVMSEYKLGPNGGILTACNLFATRFDQVMVLCEKPREPPLDTIAVDTAGQIEIFTWSASGNIVTELFASTFPTVVLYVIDTPRCLSPQTFMSNMMQACSILYKTRLPMVLVFNKIDVSSHELPLQWMKDFNAFQSSLDSDDSYAASLSRSLSLVLDEFYENLTTVGVSSVTGEGMDAMFEALQNGASEYEQFYKVELEERKVASRQAAEDKKAADMQRLEADIAAGRHGRHEVVMPSIDSKTSDDEPS